MPYCVAVMFGSVYFPTCGQNVNVQLLRVQLYKTRVEARRAQDHADTYMQAVDGRLYADATESSLKL